MKIRIKLKRDSPSGPTLIEGCYDKTDVLCGDVGIDRSNLISNLWFEGQRFEVCGDLGEKKADCWMKSKLFRIFNCDSSAKWYEIMICFLKNS